MIVHIDVDAFYAGVEIRDNPSLRGKPVAVAGSSRRAVVLTASYEARPFGVRSAVPLYRAREACPHLIVVPPRMEVYRNVSREIFAVFTAHAPRVQGLSLDEAFLDLGEIPFGAAMERAAAIRTAVRTSVGLTVSAGVAAGKMVAKILSDECKPDGLRGIEPGSEAAYLAPLPVGRLWGVGPKTQARLESYGIRTIGDVAALDDARCAALFASGGAQLRELARGIDRRPVENDRETKSISTEETFEYDLRDETDLIRVLKVQAIELSEKLGAEGLGACTIGIKIRLADRRTIGRQTHLAEPTRDARRIYAASRHCLRRAELDGAPVRLLGTRAASLIAGAPAQPSLFEQPAKAI